MYLNSLSALGDESVDRDYFESSVYRNILDMLGTLNNIRQELREEMIVIASMPGLKFFSSGMNSSTPSYNTRMGPGKMANGYAINKLGKNYEFQSWIKLAQKIPDNPWKMHKRRQDYFGKEYLVDEVFPDQFPSVDRVEKALMNSRSMGMDLVNRIRNIEWELNRVHLPMVEDLRKVGLLLNDFIRDLPTALPTYDLVNHKSRFDVRNGPLVAYKTPIFTGGGPSVEALDRGRLAAYKAQHTLRQMKTWLAEMTEKIKTRSEFDAAALERIAAEAAARAKAERQAEADAAAEAERKAAEEEADAKAEAERQAVKEDNESARSVNDAKEAKKTAAKAAEVENQIISSDDVPDKGKGGVWLALAGGAAAFFLLS